MGDRNGDDTCDGCMAYWPCDAIQLADEIDRLRAELAEQERVTRCLEGALKGEQDRIARVRELCDDLHPFCKGGHVLDAVRDAATAERNEK